eukprot:209116-Chlamydomonas_euryale.AAC.1
MLAVPAATAESQRSTWRAQAQRRLALRGWGQRSSDCDRLFCVVRSSESETAKEKLLLQDSKHDKPVELPSLFGVEHVCRRHSARRRSLDRRAMRALHPTETPVWTC